MTFAELQAKMSLADPTPLREAPKNEKFVRVFWITSVVCHLLLVYSLVVVFGERLHVVGAELARAIPILQGRFDFLKTQADLSYSCMASVLIVSIVLTPISIIAQIHAYKKIVIAPGGTLNGVSLYSLGYILQGWLISSIFFFVIFVSTPISADVARVGMAGILLWPVFPVIALPFVCIVQRVLFSSFVLLWKFSMKSKE